MHCVFYSILYITHSKVVVAAAVHVHLLILVAIAHTQSTKWSITVLPLRQILEMLLYYITLTYTATR